MPPRRRVRAEALKLTAADLLEQGVVDEIVARAARRGAQGPGAAVAATASAVRAALAISAVRDGGARRAARGERFRQMGRVLEAETA
jgi:acetyl-CoA carboxylase carboxyl transferase subunit alpha